MFKRLEDGMGDIVYLYQIKQQDGDWRTIARNNINASEQDLKIVLNEWAWRNGVGVEDCQARCIPWTINNF